MLMGKEVYADQWGKTKKVINKDEKIKLSKLECVQADMIPRLGLVVRLLLWEMENSILQLKEVSKTILTY